MILLVYTANRERLDGGARATWPEWKLDTEVSAIQHAMNLFHRDRAAFFAEYQNDAEETEATANALTPDDVLQKIGSVKYGTVPLVGEHLTACIEVQKETLKTPISFSEFSQRRPLYPLRVQSARQ